MSAAWFGTYVKTVWRSPHAAELLDAKHRLAADLIGQASSQFKRLVRDVLAEVAGAAPVVVNCTGAAAHDLVPDSAVRPIRGQALIVTNPGLTDFFIGPVPDGSRFAYMFPHGDTVLLGGTEQGGDWNTEADPQTARDILAACTAVEPRLAGAEILESRVGLRPYRPEIRLEAEPGPGGGLVVHNYGHGGAGVTLAWGCARAVTELVLSRP